MDKFQINVSWTIWKSIYQVNFFHSNEYFPQNGFIYALSLKPELCLCILSYSKVFSPI